MSLWQDVLYDTLNVAYTLIGRIRLASVKLDSKCHFARFYCTERKKEWGYEEGKDRVGTEP